MGHAKPKGESAIVTAAVGAAADLSSSSSTRLGTYLRKLREGYGYTLRKVEERAMAMGEAIDNSQLSRFEKGKAIPSFDKLRALGRVFNVPVQNFSDVLDLEEYQDLRPDCDDYSSLLRLAGDCMARGDHGSAYVSFERALEIAEDEPDSTLRAERIADTRCRMATALRGLGKLYMTERELREILKTRHQLPPATRMRTLLQLAYLYRELGDLYLASVLAKESLALARADDDLLTQAGVLNSLGNMQHDEGDPATAVESYREALAILERLEGHREMEASVRTNLGGCLITLRRDREGLAMLRDAHTRARTGGFRRVAALSLSRMAEAFMQAGDHEQSREALTDSDSLATHGEDCYNDILFLNSYHRWTMARQERNATREKIAFGRLRHLRSLIQRRFSEVEAFDCHVARIGR